MIKEKSFSIFLTAIIVLSAFVFMKPFDFIKYQTPAPIPYNSETTSTEPQDNLEKLTIVDVPSIPANWVTYENSEWGIEFKHPNGWQRKNDPERGPLAQVNIIGNTHRIAINKNETVVGHDDSTLYKFNLKIGNNIVSAAQVYPGAQDPATYDDSFIIFSVATGSDRFYFRLTSNNDETINTIISTIKLK